MYTQDNPYYPVHGFPRTWSADDLAAAVPLRLSERLSLGLARFESRPQAANDAHRPPRSYLPAVALPPYLRVR